MKLKPVEFTEDGITGGPEVYWTHGFGGKCWTEHPFEIFSLDEKGDEPYLLYIAVPTSRARELWREMPENCRALVRRCKVVAYYNPIRC